MQPEGYGSPYVKIFTSLGEVTSRCVSFTYKYSQKEDDFCQLRFEGNDPNMADYPEFQEGCIYRVQWGYLGEDKSKTRTVEVRSVKTTYISEFVALDISCTDRVSRCKATSSKKVHKGSVGDIANDIAKKNGFNVNDPSIVLSDTITKTNVETPAYLDKGGNYTTAISSTNVAKTLILRNFDTLPQANKSDYNILREAADNDPNGPFEVFGRDNTLYVQKLNTNQPAVRSYTWAGGNGELLGFEPESKQYSKHGALHVVTFGSNPKNKSFFGLNHNEYSNGTGKLGGVTNFSPRFTSTGYSSSSKSSAQSKEVIVGADKKLNVSKVNDKATKTSSQPNADKPTSKISIGDLGPIDKTKEFPLNGEVAPTDSNYEINSADKLDNDYVVKQDSGLLMFGTLDPTSPAYLNTLGNFTTAISTTAVIKPISTLVPIDYNQSVPTEEHDVEEAAGIGRNKQAQDALDSNPSTAKMVGDPDLESGMVITVLGAANKHSGNYYIWECIHTINAHSEYTMTTQMNRNGKGKSQADSPIALPITRFDNTAPINNDITLNKSIGPELQENETTLPNQSPGSPTGKSVGVF